MSALAPTAMRADVVAAERRCAGEGRGLEGAGRVEARMSSLISRPATIAVRISSIRLCGATVGAERHVDAARRDSGRNGPARAVARERRAGSAPPSRRSRHQDGEVALDVCQPICGWSSRKMQCAAWCARARGGRLSAAHCDGRHAVAADHLAHLHHRLRQVAHEGAPGRLGIAKRLAEQLLASRCRSAAGRRRP